MADMADMADTADTANTERPRSDTGPLVSGVQEWLYVIIVAALSLYLVIGVVLWSWMILVGRPAPDAFTTILAAIAGALAGIVTPLQGPPARRGQTRD